MALFGRSKTPLEESVVEEEVGITETEDEAPATYATVDQMQALIEAQGRQMQDTLTRLLTPQQQVDVEQDDFPAIPDEVSDDEILEAIDEGDNKKVLKLQRQQRERDRLIAAREIAQVRKESVTKISDVNQRLASEKLPDFVKYGSEIDTILKSFPAAVRGDESVIKFVYNSVRGSHLDEEVEDRAKQLLEAQKRQANLGPTDEPSGRRSMVRSQIHEDDDEAEFFGDDTEYALQSSGRGKDQMAVAFGYKDWADYVKSAKAYAKKPTHKWSTRRQ